MSLTDIKSGLGATLKAANSNLRWYDNPPSNPSAPCLFAGLPSGQYGDDFNGDWSFTLPLILLLPRPTNDRAASSADEYVDPTGTKSVAAGVRTDPTLGDTCHSAIVTRFDEGIPEQFEYLLADYLSVTFTVEVLA